MILASSIVWFMKHSDFFNLLQSSTSGCLILVHRNDISVAQSGRPLWEIHSNFVTTKWKVTILFPYSSITFPTVNIHLAAIDVNIWGTSSPNSCTAYFMYSLILIDIFLLFRYLIFITKKVLMLPFVAINHGNVSSMFLMMS